MTNKEEIMDMIYTAIDDFRCVVYKHIDKILELILQKEEGIISDSSFFTELLKIKTKLEEESR